MKLLITYVVLLSIQVPFNIMYFGALLSSGSESLMTAFGMGYPIIAFLALAFLVASRGTIIFAAPILLLVGIAFTWIAMLPSSFWGVQVIRFAERDGKIANSKFLHIILQFCFLLDLLDTVYLAAFKYKRGKAAAVLVCLAYVLCISFVVILLASFI